VIRLGNDTPEDTSSEKHECSWVMNEYPMKEIRVG
jgi:hypothetical protein